ncbi:MAG: phosphoribosyltransferase family protein [Oligoflexales bacterium]
MQLPFVPIRKAGKIPGPCFQSSYKKEYGYDAFELAQSTLEVGQKVLIVDDLVATGGSAQAAIDLIDQAGAKAIEFFAFTEIASEGGATNLPIPSTILFRK